MRLTLSSAAALSLVLCIHSSLRSTTSNAFQCPTPEAHGTVVRSRSPMFMAASMIDGSISNSGSSGDIIDGDGNGDSSNTSDSKKKASSSSASSSSAKADSSSAMASAAAESVDWDWNQLAADAFTEDDERPIILFDGVCNLCDAGINFAMDQDENATFRFCSLQSKVAQSLILRSGRSLDDEAKIMLITKDEAFVSSDAVSRICMGLDAAPLKWLGHMGQFTPTWVRESIYQFVSNNRYKFGENDSCRLDFDGTYTGRFLSDPMDE